MPKKKEAEKYAVLGKKDCWHLYGLQMLTPAKFVVVVDKVIRGQYQLIGPKSQSRITA